MALYESVFVARQDLSKADVSRLADSFTKIIEQHGGKVVKNEYWGLRSLAYPINKNKKGHYSLLGVDAPAAAIAELTRNYRITEEILRHMNVAVDVIEEGPSAILRSRDDNELPEVEAA